VNVVNVFITSAREMPTIEHETCERCERFPIDTESNEIAQNFSEIRERKYCLRSWRGAGVGVVAYPPYLI